jgi:predicted O-linked N-acetylglucosamine transferase (SPINDLY family)
VWLPDSYQVNDSKRRIADGKPTRQEAGLPPSGFVFCCFNNNYKITPDVFDRWMSLLDRVTGSVLWLLEDNAAAARNLRKEAACRGVNPDRLVFAPRMELDQHLARHQLADLFLDTLPCNAHTTASDALWAGLPVLTCMGGTFAGRVAAGLLAAAGVPELITRDLDEYEALALKIALTPSMLDGLRTRLARDRRNAALFDAARFCRHIEQAYIAMWERAQRGELPAHLEIDPV